MLRQYCYFSHNSSFGPERREKRGLKHIVDLAGYVIGPSDARVQLCGAAALVVEPALCCVVLDVFALTANALLIA